MQSAIRIRRAGESDALALAMLAERTFRAAFEESNGAADMQRHCERHYAQALQLAEIRDPKRETWVAEDGCGLKAFVQLRLGAVSPLIPVERAIEIQRFYVDAAHHGTRRGSCRIQRGHGALARRVGEESESLGLLPKMGVRNRRSSYLPRRRRSATRLGHVPRRALSEGVRVADAVTGPAGPPRSPRRLFFSSASLPRTHAWPRRYRGRRAHRAGRAA